MIEYSKENPGCYHSLINYLSDLTGLSVRKTIEIKTREGLLQNPKARRKKLGYNNWFITVVDTDGKRYPYMASDTKRYDQQFPELVVDHFEVSVYRPLTEFGIELNPAGNYRDSLGGGWYSNTPLLEHNGNYFAIGMECAHR